MKKTTIGSLPYTDPKKACDLVLKYTHDFPAWPQLPRRSFRENMCVQYSEKFPGIIVDEKNAKVSVSWERFGLELAEFYSHFEKFKSDIDYFKISEDYAAGFYEMKARIERGEAGTVKCQTVGPITFGMTVKDEKGRPIYYEPSMRQAVEYQCLMKSVWQISRFYDMKGMDEIMLFLDEPYLASYGSAFTSISKDDIISSISGVVTALRVEYGNMKIGVHCCANTDWSILCETGIDLISFDSYGFFDSLALYSGKLAEFVENGGGLAWGIVPTGEEHLKLENAGSLSTRLRESVKTLVSKGINEKKLLAKSFVTPACGFGSQSEDTAEKCLKLLSEIE
jgi:hypothetical protein